jgi:hypothetical protein
MVLQCQSLHSLHLDLSPLYFALEGRITTVPSAHGDLEATPKFHLAEDIYSRVTPCILENSLEDFVTRSSFYNFMKRIQNMKSLREFNLIGRASNEEQVIVPNQQEDKMYYVHSELHRKLQLQRQLRLQVKSGPPVWVIFIIPAYCPKG